MAKERVDEVLGVFESDTEVIPRYDVVNQYGQILHQNVKLVLKNEIIQKGMTIDKVAMDECLAASGVTTGTATSYILDQPGFVLFDGALIRFRIHSDSGATPTINVNGTGAKAIMQSKHKPLRAGLSAGTWLTAIYSETFDFFLLQGSNSISTLKYGNDVGQISAFELEFCGHGDPYYSRNF